MQISYDVTICFSLVGAYTFIDPMGGFTIAVHRQATAPTKELPPVFLRRRIPLVMAADGGGAAAGAGGLEGMQMSPFADCCLLLLARPTQLQAAPFKDHFQTNAPKCRLTGTKFGLLTHRHHCHVCGFQFCDSVCDYKQVRNSGYSLLLWIADAHCMRVHVLMDVWCRLSLTLSGNP